MMNDVETDWGTMGQDCESDLPVHSAERMVKDLCEKIKTLLDDVCEEILKRHKATITQAIHYTSIGSLMSILGHANNSSAGKNNKGFLHLYDTVHFNDPDEGNFFVRHLPDKYAWLRDASEKKGYAYVASFILPSQDKDMSDNLVFWRTYGEQGEGCSLLLSAPDPSLQKVLYDREEVEQTIDTLDPVLKMLSCFVEHKQLRGSLREKYKIDIGKEIAKVVWESLERIRYLYKSSAYTYEKECRFIVTKPANDEEIFFEYTDSNNFSSHIRHYCKHETLEISRLLATDSIITLGPSVPYRENIQHCLEVLLKKSGLSATKVRCSEILYRKF